MSWADSPAWPPVNGVSDTQDWYWFIKAYRALRERAWVVSGGTDRNWPRYSSPSIYATGTIASIGEVEPDGDMYLTDPAGTTWDGAGDNPWITGETSVPWAPSNFRVVIEAGNPTWDDPVAIAMADITGMEVTPATPTIYFENIRDYVTSHEITSIESLVGKTYYVIPSYGIWWNERWPEWPNAQEIDFGTITSSTTTSIYDSTISDREARWRWRVDPNTGVGVMAGKELVTTVNGFMVRIQIVNHDRDGNITFAEQAAPPTGDYAIIEPGRRYRLGRRKHMPWAWYRGAGMSPLDVAGSSNEHYSLHPDDALTATKNPASSVSWDDESPSPPFNCEELAHPNAFDADMWSDAEEECGNGDRPFSPDLPKSWRWVQATAEALGVQYVAEKSYVAAAGIPHMTLATLFQAAGVNAQTGTVVSAVYDMMNNVTTITHTGITLPWDDIETHWAVDGIFNGSGGGEYTYYGTDQFSGNTFTIPGDVTADAFAGKSLIVSFGWTRFIPREFLRAFSQQVFMPDLNVAAAHDPPGVIDWDESGDLGVGVWKRKEPSTHYFEHTGQQPTQSIDELTVGEYVRWSGDNWGDGIVHGGSDDASGTMDPQLPYWKRFCVATHPDETERTTISEQVSGVVSGTSIDGRLTDDTKDWYTDIWYGGSVRHTESGTATGGSTTSLDDSTKELSTAAGAFFSSRRWQDEGWDFPYQSFVVEVQIDAVWHERIITGCTQDAGGVTIEWDEELPTTADGKAWRIREATERARWQEHRLLIGFPDGVVFETYVLHNSDKTIWYPPIGRAIELGCTYRVLAPRPGGVYKIEATEPEYGETREWFRVGTPEGEGYFMVAPEGADAVRTGVASPANFHSNVRENLPTLKKRYGRLVRGDYFSRTFYQQIYDVINAEVWTKHAPSFTNDGDDNTLIAEGEVDPGGGGTVLERFQDETDAVWGGPSSIYATWTATPNDGVRPYVDVNSFITIDDYSTTKKRQYAYALLENVPTFFNSDADLYTFAVGPAGEGVPDDTDQDDDGVVKFFENYGDPVLREQWQLWNTADFGGPLSTDTRISEAIGGNLLPPGWPQPDPLDPNLGGTAFNTYTSTSGYTVTDEVVILKWNVPGGFTYVASN